MPKLRSLLIVALLTTYIFAGMLPAWKTVKSVKHGRDYATYHYAVQEAWDDGNPYDTAALSKRGQPRPIRLYH